MRRYEASVCREVASAGEGEDEGDSDGDGESEADPVEEESDEDADERVEEGDDADEAESVVGDASARAVCRTVESAIVGGVASVVVAGGDADSFDAVEPDVVSLDAADDSRGDADSDIETPLVQFLIAAGI
ncbi:hypothetical protein C481_09797 [Natrialba asiatica DSM 12278]|uniref:Uncharacterized protein n=2 Tax=Natrialba asiatica TaxID=64602 RepID=M0AWL6_NATA1|nr:hypothetical protein C481_09797 [Natrialba asiatica DSM 12278]